MQRKIDDNLKAQKNARTEKNNENLNALKKELSALKNEKNALKAEMQKEQSIYHECVKPYIDAERTASLSEAYSTLL